MRRLPLLIASAALLAAGPWMSIGLHLGDGIPLDPGRRSWWLSLTAWASAGVFVLGAAYLADAVARAERNRGALGGLWVLSVLAHLVVSAPARVEAARRSPLAEVLGAEAGLWAWAIAATAGLDLVAGACILASRSLEREGGEGLEGMAREALGGGSSLISLGLSTPCQGLRGSSAGPALAPGPPPTPASAEPLPYLCKWGCGKAFATAPEAWGHSGSCPQHRRRIVESEPPGGVA